MPPHETSHPSQWLFDILGDILTGGFRLTYLTKERSLELRTLGLMDGIGDFRGDGKIKASDNSEQGVSNFKRVFYLFSRSLNFLRKALSMLPSR